MWFEKRKENSFKKSYGARVDILFKYTVANQKPKGKANVRPSLIEWSIDQLIDVITNLVLERDAGASGVTFFGGVTS